MNRQLKFRAYNRETGGLLSEDCIDSIVNLDQLISLGRIDVMQFTGFYDSNVNEIYEGDILTNCAFTRDGLYYTRHLVVWSKLHGEWKLNDSSSEFKNKSSSLWKQLHDYKYEIVGNIYNKH